MGALADRVRVVLALLGPLGAGSRVLMLRLLTRFGWWPVACGVAVAAYAMNRYRTWIVWMLLAWCAVAWMHAPSGDADAPGDGAEKSTEAAAGEGARDDILALLYELIGDAHGVHLRTVLAHLQEYGHWEGKTVADLRQHLEALGIPVQLKVKVAGTPTRGVLKADLDALPPIEETPPSPDPSPTI